MDLPTLIKRYEDVHGIQGNIGKYTVVPSGKVLLESIKNRIFKEGKNSSGQSIGDYSTKPMYVKRSQFANPSAFKPYGKVRSASIVSRGGRLYAEERKRKTMYLPDGYKELRSLQGKETAVVNLDYRGKTKRAYVMQETNTGAILGLNTVLAAAIRSGQETKYNAAIFSATQSEIDSYNAAVNARIARITSGLVVDGLGLQSLVETPTDTLVDNGIY